MNKTEFSRRSFLKLGATTAAAATGCYLSLNAGELSAASLNPPGKRPYLLISEDLLPAFREKLSKEPSRKIYERYTREAAAGRRAETEAYILLALIGGSNEAKQAAGRALMRSLRDNKPRGELVLAGKLAPPHLARAGASAYPIYDFSVLRFMHRLLNQYDVVESFDALSPEERKEFRDYTVWMVGQLMSEKIKTISQRIPDRRHNFHTDNITIIATAALAFPEHPQAKEWLGYALAEFEFQMKESVEDGAWHETPRYHGAVLRSLIPLAYALKRNAGVDWFKNDGLRSMLDWLVRCQTPRDRVYGKWLQSGQMTGTNGAETMAYAPDAVSESPGIGDAEWVNYWFAVLGMAAPAYRDSDPGFAGRLMWGWERAGGPYAPESNLLMAPLILIDPTIKPIRQELVSEAMPKSGYAILRSDYDKPSEKYFIFTCGHRREQHWAGHKHRDQNSFSLFAEGVPLSLDAGTGPYSTPEQSLWHKSTLSHSTVLFGGRDQSKEDGKIIRFVSQKDADYLIGDASRAAGETSGVLQFHRHVLFVKPDYFVIWDFIRSYVPTEWLLHSPAREIRKSERSIEFVTPWEVNLDAHFLLPKGVLEITEGEGRFGNWRKEGERGTPPFARQKYVRVKNEANRDFLTILHPHKAGEEKLSAKLVGTEENVLEVKLGAGQTDTIMLFPVGKSYRDEALGITFEGRVGVVRNGTRSDSLILVEGRRLASKDRQVTA
jgi:hypothetical protein